MEGEGWRGGGVEGWRGGGGGVGGTSVVFGSVRCCAVRCGAVTVRCEIVLLKRP